MFLRPLRRVVADRTLKSHFHTSSVLWATRKVLQKFKLADIGEGITECEVISWSVQPKARIQAFDALCEVQSDKASVEITSPYDGIVTEILVQEGEVAKVGAPLCIIEAEEDIPEGGAAPVQPAKAPTPEPAPLPVAEKAVELAPSTPPPSPPPRNAHPMDPKFVSTSTDSSNVLAAPSTRHFAREKNVDLALLVPGSGRNGRIEKKDIENYLTKPLATAAGTTTIQPTTANDVVVELGRTRYNMYKAMVKSLEIPHFGYSTTLDLTELHAILPTLNAHIPQHYLPPSAQPKSAPAVSPAAIYPPPTLPSVSPHGQYTRLTYLPILLKTLSKAMLEWPIFRSSITPPSSPTSDKPTLTIRPHADISIALSTPTGLYAPTVQSTDTMSIYALAAHLQTIAHLGRQVPTGLTPAEMPKRGGSITVSNVGAIGKGDFASPVLVPGGGVAIVAIGRAKWVWDVERRPEGERRLKVGVSWSGDHRVVEGAELAAFVETWRGYVENPHRLIADGV